MNFELRVIDVRGKGVLCTASSDTGDSFWLPRGDHVDWSNAPHPGTNVTANVPGWLARKHRQLVAFESARQSNHEKVNAMTDRPEDAGRGALFKNDQKEKPSHPDYKGDITIKGRKFWISAWLKTSEKTGKKFMSLALREAEERGDDRRQQQAKRDGQRPVADDIPF
jgi:hypothetical protein